MTAHTKHASGIGAFILKKKEGAKGYWGYVIT